MPKRRGFTMVEMVASATILVALLMISMQFFHGMAVHRRTTRQRELAVQEVANLMERISAIAWQDLTAEKANQVQISDLAGRRLPGAKLTIEVSQPAEKPAADEPSAKRISIALAWEDSSRRLGRPVRLTAWRYRAGGGN